MMKIKSLLQVLGIRLFVHGNARRYVHTYPDIDVAFISSPSNAFERSGSWTAAGTTGLDLLHGSNIYRANVPGGTRRRE